MSTTTDDFEIDEDIIAGLHPVDEDDEAIQHWLRTEVAATYDAIMADPSRLISAEEVSANLDALYEAWVKKEQQSSVT